MKSKIRYWRVAYPRNEVTKEQILSSFRAWDAHAAHGDTYSLRKKMAKQVEEIIGEPIQIKRKINSNRLVRAKRTYRQMKYIRKKQQKGEADGPPVFVPAARDAGIPPWE